ncbi:coiled-coil domain-containing protein 157-like [Motacilla alba alba]|uniref:coiled-coil domain-containing protein 157-like n=1 Tax=Motacilla alba alba TaxID=1094192 RepID=UPI0018D51429|nr:coiled-coil domain-containing protein 157-like [Motacilla alba alba]
MGRCPWPSRHSQLQAVFSRRDRLLLLLQSFTGYADTVLSGRAVPPPRGPAPGMSAGLTARTFWSSMLKLGAFCQQLRDEAGKYQKETLKCILPEVLESGTPPEAAQSTSVRPNASVQPRASPSLALSTSSVPTQTPGSPLGSCDSCSSAQASLHEVGRAITSICQSQNIPSALSKFQEVLEDSAGRRNLSATDMSYWASEQSKDLSRINKHLQGLLQQLNPVKAQLEEMGKQKEKLQKQVEDFSRKLQAEKDTQAEQQKKAEQSLKAKEKEHSEAVARLEQDKEDLRRGAALLEERLSALKEELAVKEVAVQELELSKTTLLEEMRTTMVARSQVLELEEKVQVLTGQRDSLEQELSATSVQLEKEKVRVESMFRHEEVRPAPERGTAEPLLLSGLWGWVHSPTRAHPPSQSLQAKQRTLLQQLDSLDREREELQASLGEAEEDKARLAEQLEQSQQQSGKQLQAQQELLDTLQREKLALEQSILELQANTSRLQEQAQELRERERLLVLFPDLHIPTETQFESSGNFAEDMKSQLRANKIRMEVLERENTQLEALLAKVKAAAEQGVLKLVPEAQLGSQLHREASRQDTGRLSSRSSGDSTGVPGCIDKAWHRAPSSQHSKKLRAEPSSQAKPCLTLPVRRLGLGLPSLHTGAHRK